MAAEGRINITIGGDNKGFVGAIQPVESSLGSLTGLLKGLAGAGGVLYLAKQGFDMLKNAIGAAANEVKSWVTEAASFETSMRNVNSISQMSEQQLKGFSDEILNLSNTLPQSAKTLADGLYDIASSGFQGADGMKVLTASAKAASAGLTDTAVSAKGITAVLNAYGLEAKDAQWVSDVMFKTVDRGVVSFEELTGTIGDILGTGKMASLRFEELSGALAYMTTKGINAAEATTALNQLVLTTVKSNKELTQVLKNAGYESGEAALKHLGLAGTLKIVQDATGGSISKLTDLYSNIRAVKGGGALLATGFDELIDYLEEFNNVAGATDKALEQQAMGFEYNLGILQNNLTNLKITLGNALLPVLNEFIQWFTQGTDVVDKYGNAIGRTEAPMARFKELVSGAAEKLAEFLQNNWPSIESGLNSIFDTIGQITNALPDMWAAFDSPEYEDLSFGSKLLKYFNDELVPQVKDKAEEMWGAFGDWIDENKSTIQGWGKKLGEFIGDALVTALKLGASEWGSDTNSAQTAGEAFATGVIEGIEKAFSKVNIWDLLWKNTVFGNPGGNKYQIGSGMSDEMKEIILGPDWKKEEQAYKIQMGIDVVANTDEAQAKLQELRNTLGPANELKNIEITENTSEIDPNIKNLQNGVDALGNPIKVQILDNIPEEQEKVEGLAFDILYGPWKPNILITDNTIAEMERLAYLRKNIDSMPWLNKITINDNTEQAKGNMTSLQEKINSLKGKTIDIVTNVIERVSRVFTGDRQFGGYARTDLYPRDLGIGISKGEMIIPKKITDAIRRGQGSLAGVATGGGGVNLSVVITGNSITKDTNIRQLADQAATGIMRKLRAAGVTI